jgi:hypothetical protein
VAVAAAASRARVGRCLLYLSPRCRVWFDEQSEGISVKNRSGAFQQACVWTAIPPGPYRLIPLIVVGASSSRSLLACRRLISRWTQDLQAAAEFAITEYIFSLEDHHQSPSICPHGCLPSSASSTRTQHHRHFCEIPDRAGAVLFFVQNNGSCNCKPNNQALASRRAEDAPPTAFQPMAQAALYLKASSLNS